MQAVHNVEGERVYELTPELREKFDECFPHCSRQYPKIYVTVIPLDTEENQILPNLSGVLVKYDARFENTPCWQEKGRHYEISVAKQGDVALQFNTRNLEFGDDNLRWNSFIMGHSHHEIQALEAEMEKLTRAPTSADELGEAWFPFASGAISPSTAWQIWLDNLQRGSLSIMLEELGIPVADIHMGKKEGFSLICSYRGVISGNLLYRAPLLNMFSLLLLLDGKLRPIVKASRSMISSLPLELIVAIYGILKGKVIGGRDYFSIHISDWRVPSLPVWRKIRGTKLERWLEVNLHDYVEHMMGQFSQPMLSGDETPFSIGGIWFRDDYLHIFFMASMQDTYQIKVNYEEGQVITFSNKDSEENSKSYDLFPPMMFCGAATQLSRRYLCSADGDIRRCITEDHPYAAWLLKNAVALDKYFMRQFQQIVSALRSASSEHIVDICNSVREQLLSLPEHHGVDMASCPQLSQADFWEPGDDQ